MSLFPANKAPICPQCGLQMVERTNKQKGTKFYGCKKFPHCRETLPIDGQDEETDDDDDDMDEFDDDHTGF